MPWWGWVSIGIILMGLELTAVDAAFYLIFVGAAAVCVGIVGLAGVELPVWGQLLAFAVLAVASMVLFRGRLYDRIRGGLPGFEYKVAGRIVSVSEDVPRGGADPGQPAGYAMDRGQRGHGADHRGRPCAGGGTGQREPFH